MFAHVSIWGVIVGAISALVVGTLWYSPFMFGKTWSKVTGVTEANMKTKRNKVMPLLVVVSLVTAYALSLVIVYLHAFVGGSWAKAGAEASLLVGIGFATTAVLAHGAFEYKDKDLFLINAGNRIVTLFIMGLIIAAFLK